MNAPPRARGTRHVVALALCALLGGAGVLQLLGNGGLLAWLLAAFLVLGASFVVRPRAGELALVLKCIAGLVAALALLTAGLFAAWESAEVIVLRQTDEQGGTVQERLWVIDFEGQPSFATDSAKARVARLRARPRVELVRAGRTECRMAVVLEGAEAAEEREAEVLRLYEQKYGWRLNATRLLGFVLGVPDELERSLVRLEPCPA